MLGMDGMFFKYRIRQFLRRRTATSNPQVCLVPAKRRNSKRTVRSTQMRQPCLCQAGTPIPGNEKAEYGGYAFQGKAKESRHFEGPRPRRSKADKRRRIANTPGSSFWIKTERLGVSFWSQRFSNQFNYQAKSVGAYLIEIAANRLRQGVLWGIGDQASDPFEMEAV